MVLNKIGNLGIIGYPIEHSLSPLMQNAAIAHDGLPYNYTALPVRPEDLRAAVLGMKALQFRGFNVTIPHKISIIPLLDAVDESVKRIGAVNTVLIEGGKMLGYNTDCSGFIADLISHDCKIEGRHAVLLGAGGAARAVLWGLISQGIQSLAIGVRDVAKAQPTVDAFSEFITIDVFHWDDPAFQVRLQEAELLINTTPLGMAPRLDQAVPINWAMVRRNTFVCDVIYNPAETRFLQSARANGNRTLNGMGMLAEQGAAALKIWSGVSGSVRVMMEALTASLK